MASWQQMKIRQHNNMTALKLDNPTKNDTATTWKRGQLITKDGKPS
jgi:hypothetical protein